MPRVAITRDQTGGPKTTSAQGERSNNVTVNCTYASNVNISQHHQVIWSTGTGATALHQSKKVTGAPSGYIGYIHAYSGNTIFAVTRLDVAKKTIQIEKQGTVKNGVHQF